MEFRGLPHMIFKCNAVSKASFRVKYIDNVFLKKRRGVLLSPTLWWAACLTKTFWLTGACPENTYSATPLSAHFPLVARIRRKQLGPKAMVICAIVAYKNCSKLQELQAIQK